MKLHCIFHLNLIANYRTNILYGNRVIIEGDRRTVRCTTADSAYSPPHWHFYSLTPGAKPCGFDSNRLYPGIPLCPSVPRISVNYSSSQQNLTTLTIRNATDAGTYTCGAQNPNKINRSHSMILGVIGK